MPKQATKAADSAFYKARIAASKCNDRLASREGASEELGIDRTRLARIELGSLNPYPEEVLLMADYYDAPELANHYCSQICPLGRKTVPPAEARSIDRLTIRIISALGEADGITEAILDIAEDGMANSETERQNSIDFFKNTLQTRLNDPKTGAFIIIMQRLHENDLTKQRKRSQRKHNAHSQRRDT